MMTQFFFLLLFVLNFVFIKSGKVEPTFESLKSDNIKWINSNEFYQLVQQFKQNSKNILMIDTRSSNEYNGWKSFTSLFKTEFNFNDTGLSSLYDFKSGHVTNSFNLDSDWLHLFDPTQIKTLIETRTGLKQDKKISIVLYDTNKQRLEKVKNFFNENYDIDLIYICKLSDSELNQFILNSNVTGNLFFQEPFYDQLLSPEALFAILRPHNDSYVTNTKPITDIFLFEVGPENFYEQSHIPTAVHLKIEDFMIKNKRRPKQEIFKNLLNYGILPYNAEMVILYGNPDPMSAFRVAVIMKSLGVKDVHVLNGGFRSWLIKNYPLETYKTKAIVMKNRIPENMKLFEEQSQLALTPINYLVDQNYVSDLVKNNQIFKDQYLLVDVRTYDEHVGDFSGYPEVKAKGRIPGSLWGKGGSEPSQLEDYRNPDFTMRPGWEILKMWDELGIDYKKKNLIFYCGDGMRSSEVLFYAEVMGLYKISMYDGGWVDWSSNLKNTFQLGPNSDGDKIVFEKYTTTSVKTTLMTNSTAQLSTKTQGKPSTSSGLKTTKKPSLNSMDNFYKNQFDSVTADPNYTPKNEISFISLFISLILVYLF